MDCPICYEDISSDELVVLKCSHKFHYDCIMKEYKTQLDNTNNIKIIFYFHNPCIFRTFKI